jgi:hypothetical protein
LLKVLSGHAEEVEKLLQRLLDEKEGFKEADNA